MKAVFDPFYVKRLHGPNVKTGRTSGIWPSRCGPTSGSSKRPTSASGW